MAATFKRRHIGPDDEAQASMLGAMGLKSMGDLISKAVPDQIRSKGGIDLGPGLSESDALAELATYEAANQVWTNFIGQGFYGTETPSVIRRGILENPGWYTQYTAYQAEISQGRLEALLYFQTMVTDLTGMDIAGASLLDESTAAAEAVSMCRGMRKPGANDLIFVASDVFTQTTEVIKTRAWPLGSDVRVLPVTAFDFEDKPCAVVIQYPGKDGSVGDYEALCAKAKESGCMVIVIADLLALTLLKPPGEWGADVVVGNTQRFGVPMGCGGPHAGYLATRDAFKRRMPGRLVGISKSRSGKRALRLALQTREQHIRRDKATSNICTAQVLLAVMSVMYGIYHGPDGLKAIATNVRSLTGRLSQTLRRLGLEPLNSSFFDTLSFQIRDHQSIKRRASERRLNLNYSDDIVSVSLDETTTEEQLIDLIFVLTGEEKPTLATEQDSRWDPRLERTSAFMTHPVFHSYRTETELMRYMKRLESKDLSLTHAMIPLGSCTMKLNAASELYPVSWPGFSKIHPFAPKEQISGYLKMFQDLESWLSEITGFAATSLQPNSGAQGEYAGLLVIKKFLEETGQGKRTTCLVPSSAHGTNPASAVLAGLKVVVVACDERGNIDVGDLSAKCASHKDDLAALMVTYPSTHGVFEEGIKDICRIVHEHGGQVYMDGANLNAQIGLCRPGDLGADVCHLNLHKTFAIPHGGGGPGMGPIACAAHLVPYLPGHPIHKVGGDKAIGPVSAAPWGSASILPISWMYIRMLGGAGLCAATEAAILNANYLASRLAPHVDILFKGRSGYVAHECIIDVRPFKKSADIDVEDFAKRLMDFGFHAPTMSWPVAGTLMIEPTESESKEELDRFCEAMIQIFTEAKKVASGHWPKDDNPLVGAPHTYHELADETWNHPYSRKEAVFPLPWVEDNKFWPRSDRIDNAFGDRNLICSCPSPEDYV